MNNIELTVAGLAIVAQVVATIALLALCYVLAQRFVAWVARACRAVARVWRVAAARRARRRARGPRAPATCTQPVGRYVADRMVEQIAREYDRRYPLQQVEREAFVVRDHFLNDRRHQAGS